MFNPNTEEHEKYFEIPIAKVLECDKISMAEKATWSKDSTVQKSKIDDMDAQQIQALIIRLQASLEEKKQMEKFVKVASTPSGKFDDLPF